MFSEESTVQHLLISRFNVVWNNPSIDRKFSSDWMTDRIALFRDLTLPSVLSQTRKDFSWLVFFDRERSKPFEWFLDDLRNNGISVVFVEENAAIPNAVRDFARRADLAVKTTHVATSRVDADDALHENYMSDVKQAVEADLALSRFVVDFPFVEVLRRHDRRKSIRAFEHRASPFLTLVEPLSDGLLTSFGVNHMELPAEFPIRRLNRIRTQMVIHEHNALNRMTTIRREISRVARRSPLKLPHLLRLYFSNLQPRA